MTKVEKISIKRSERGGRGVFAKRLIFSGELIDVSYSWDLSNVDVELMEKSAISGYWFSTPDGGALLPIGAAALVNHSGSPNACLEWKETDLGFVGYLRSITQINTGEEILIDYGIVLPNGWLP